jgi:hypothetical protein
LRRRERPRAIIGNSERRAAPQLELKDWEAHEMYNQGIKDAKKIDVRGRRLKGAEED